MIRDLPVDDPVASDEMQGERGATLIIAAAVMVVMMGMAAFAVDLGWLYLKASEAKKAAEAASLAAVVHMPYPSSDTFPTSQAWDTAVDIAATAGYPSTAVTPKEVFDAVGNKKRNQIEVEVADTVPTFFMKVFGIDTVTFERSAKAEQLPPLKLGSDEPYFATDPETPGRNRFFWASINGEYRAKEDGDPFSTRCYTGNGPPCGSSNVGSGPLQEFRDPAYYYAVDVAPADAGGTLTVELYDPTHWSGEYAAGITGDRGSGSGLSLRFRLRLPDDTPNDPTDNVYIAACDRTFGDGNSSSPGVQEWVPLCSVGAVAGIYVLEVSIDGSQVITDFSIRTKMNGNLGPSGNSTAIYGIGAMSIDMKDSGQTPTFKVVKLEEIYAGNDLIISLYDAGDVSGGSADLVFGGEASVLDCEVRVRRENGTVVDWTGDDSPGSAPCELNTSSPLQQKKYNHDWLDFRFTVPDGYVCASDCWVNVQYVMSVGATVNERTTWAARISGQPIHLVP